jgi:hypothetical protein
MFYLGDVGLFALLAGAVLLLCWSAASTRLGTMLSSLERDVIVTSAMWGASALLLWLLGSLLGVPRDFGFLVYLVPAVVVIVALSRRATIADRFHALRLGLKTLPLADKLLLVYVAFACALTFVLTLAPPSGNDYDSLVYHLAAPQRYLQAGRIVELPYDHHSYFPFSIEMWFMLGLSLKGPVLAKLFHWMCLPLSCLALWAFGRRHLSVRTGSWAAALWASLPVVQLEATTAYIDVGFSLWVILAFGCAANWAQTRDHRWVWWAGTFAGFALGSKYLGALTIAFLAVYIGLVLLQRDGQKPRALTHILVPLSFCLLALAIGGGWYVRNALWTGNPVFPFAYGVFGGKVGRRRWPPTISATNSPTGLGVGLSICCSHRGA